MLNITRKVVILFLVSVILSNTTNSLYAVNKTYKKWYFWAGIVTITGAAYYYQQEEGRKKNQTVQYPITPSQPTQPIWETDPNGDADGDGYTNIVEYREGSDPNDSKSIPQEGSHTLSVHRMKAVGIDSSLKISFIPSTSIKNTPICVIIPLKKDIWVYWTANLNMSVYKFQAILKY